MIQRAAIYCRVSTARQNADDKVSMEDQEERCRAVCQSKGWEIVHVYDEGDASAGTAQRGEFQRMLADAKTGQFDVVVVREVSRLSRVAQARHAIEDLMVNWGVSVCNARTGMVYSETEGLGASVIWMIESRMAEGEWAERSFRTSMGKNRRAARGQMPSAKAPYGYHWQEGTLAVDPDRAAIVQRIFERLALGLSTPAVAAELNAIGIPSPGGSELGWCSQTVYKIATRRAYIGEGSYGVNHWRRLNSERERQEWAQAYLDQHGIRPPRIPQKILVPGAEVFNVSTPSIVDSALFERVGALLPRTRKSARTVQRRPALLVGLLRCGECGRPMQPYWSQGRGGKVSYFYRCASHIRDTARVPCRATDRAAGIHANVPAEEIEAAVWGVLDRLLSDINALTAAIGAQRETDAVMAPALDERIEVHEKRLAKAELALTRSRRLYLEGDIDEATYRTDKTDYARQIAMLADELERMHAAEARREQQRASQAQVLEISRRWAEICGKLTPGERRELLVALLSDVTITRLDVVNVTGTLSALAGSNKSTIGSA